MTFDLEKVEFISRPSSVIYTIDASFMEEWKNTIINPSGLKPIYKNENKNSNYMAYITVVM